MELSKGIRLGAAVAIAVMVLALASYVGGGSVLYKLPDGIRPTACTMEAKVCPDGSAVGRTGPNCEFAACPETATTTHATGTLSGRVTLSPICPVERVPPDPDCAPRPHAGRVEVLRSEGGMPVAQVSSDANGYFTSTLAPGAYIVRAIGGNPFPICEEKRVVLSAQQTVHIDLSCDTGIR